MKVSLEFYVREDVVQISRELLGKVLCTKLDGAGDPVTLSGVVEIRVGFGPPTQMVPTLVPDRHKKIPATMCGYFL